MDMWVAGSGLHVVDATKGQAGVLESLLLQCETSLNKSMQRDWRTSALFSLARD
ncbi:MAG: hypothetical protein WC617_11920 [Rhodanobacter sp.]|jgi:hypothetical protein